MTTPPHINIGELFPFDVIVYATGFIGVSATHDLMLYKVFTAATGAISDARSRVKWSYYPRLLRRA
jgi:hypothetical protein